MSAQPQWSDSEQSDLLSLVAMGSPATGSATREWDLFVQSLQTVTEPGGRIDPNRLRKLLRGYIAPRRVGAFTNRALSQGLIAATGGWVISDDAIGRNAGRPCREYRWIGGAR